LKTPYFEWHAAAPHALSVFDSEFSNPIHLPTAALAVTAALAEEHG